MPWDMRMRRVRVTGILCMVYSYFSKKGLNYASESAADAKTYGPETGYERQ